MDTHLQAGEQFDRFVIVKQLGQGGMATVYLAQDVELQRLVVLKIITPALAQNDQFMARFRQEAQATARLNHAHIVQVYTTGVLPGLDLPYMALQYIEGGSLQERMTAAPLIPVHALTIARQMAEALAVAHAAGIVHRDVKPSNILLRPDETAVLADLGIAVMQQAATRLTQTKDGMPGTPHYMSPEQGSSRTIDGRSDIYSLGIVLYELLARQLPFNAESPWGIIHQHIYEPPPPLETLRPGLSAATYQLVATCLQKEPAARYQTATALAAAINQAIMVESGAAPAAPAATVAASHTTTRSLWQWALPVFLAVALLVGGGVYWQRGKTAVSPTPLPIITNITPTFTATPHPTATQPLPTSTALPTFTPVPPTPTPAVTALVVTTPVTTDQNILAYECGIQGSKVIYLHHLESGQEITLPNQPANSIVPAFAPDGSEIVYNSKASGFWHLYSSGLDGSNQLQITTGEESNYEAVWSPDSSQLAFVSNRSGNDHIYIINRDGSGLRQLTSAGKFNNDPSWSVNDKIVYESNQTGRYNIQLLPANGNVAPLSLIQQGQSSTTPAWSADGRMVAYESRVGDVRHLWVAAADGSNPLQVTFEGLLNERPAWAPNGRFLAFHSNYQQPNDDAFDIWTVEIATGTRQRLTQRGNCFNPTWTETMLENTAFATAP